MPRNKFETDQQFEGKVFSEGLTNSNIYYVSRRFTGLANSSNAGWIQQLSQAKRGSHNYSFPDPWSARNAAIGDISSGSINSAMIWVLPGQVYTYGDVNPSNNGDANFNSSSATPVDYQVTSATTGSANLYVSGSNINYYFAQGSEMKNHCDVYGLPLFNLAGTNTQSFEVNGNGNFYNYFGETSFSAGAEFLNCNNENSTIRFECNTLNMQQYFVFKLSKVAEFDLRCETVNSAGVILIAALNTATTSSMTINANIGNIFNGEGFFGPYSDFWFLFTLKNPAYTAVNINVGNINTVESAPILYTNNTVTNNNVKINIGNIKHKISSLGYNGNLFNQSMFAIVDNLNSAGVTSEVNNVYDISVGNYIGDMPILYYKGLNKLSGSKDNVVNLYCGNATTTGNGKHAIFIDGGAGLSNVNPHTSVLNIHGTYRAISGSAMHINALPSMINVDANLISYSGSVFSTAVSCSNVIMNGTFHATGSGVNLFSGTNKPILANVYSYDGTTRTYTRAMNLVTASVVLY